jgi:membrane-anchored protein YejM (alkaline phosphatase superfamily)
VTGKAQSKSSKQADFTRIVKKAYEKGVNENEITLEKILEELKTDLKNMMIS